MARGKSTSTVLSLAARLMADCLCGKQYDQSKSEVGCNNRPATVVTMIANFSAGSLLTSQCS